jgi:hypothetical protein
MESVAAKAKRLERWSGKIKNLESVGGVWLNPGEVVQNYDTTGEKVAYIKEQLFCKIPL